MKRKPLSGSLIMNFIRTFLNLLFPVITFSHASRYLGAEGIGIVSYTDSMIKYLVLIGGGGIAYYAVRETAGARAQGTKAAETAAEILLLNASLSAAACGLSLILAFGFLKSIYVEVFLIQSTILIFNAIGMEWLFQAWEEYGYLTVRTAVFNGLACLLLYVFVRNETDYVLYAAVLTGASAGGQIMNFIMINKISGTGSCRSLLLKMISSAKITCVWQKHWSRAKYVFRANLAISVYVHMDKIMLGSLTGVNAVGLYSSANYIVQAAAGLITCMTNVILPRVSFYLEKGMEKEASRLLSHAANILFMMTIPCVTGLICIGKELLYLLCGPAFSGAFKSLMILSLALLFSVYNNFQVWQVMIPHRKEKQAFLGTMVSAAVNVGLNFALIPGFGMEGAAAATLTAEAALSLFCCITSVGCYVRRHGLRHYVSCITAGCGVMASCMWIDRMNVGRSVSVLLKILLSAVSYGCILLVMKNRYMLSAAGAVIRLRKEGKDAG